jgi:predicted  nucleic acid-binding Zn-ribbon protein
MAGLDNVPQQQQITIETAKIDAELYQSMQDLNQKINALIIEFGQIHIRKKEINEELVRMDDFLEKGEDEFKMLNVQMREIVDSLDEKYPQGRINMQDGTIQYQPGAPTRKQIAEMQKQQQTMPDGSTGMKVVKE